MTATLRFADGRDMTCSNVGFSGMLWLVSRETRSPKLKRWLRDMADRPGGFADFDIRGLSDVDQEEFWAAAAKAADVLREAHGPDFAAREKCIWSQLPGPSFGDGRRRPKVALCSSVGWSKD